MYEKFEVCSEQKDQTAIKIVLEQDIISRNVKIIFSICLALPGNILAGELFQESKVNKI